MLSSLLKFLWQTNCRNIGHPIFISIGHNITFTPPYYSPSGHAHGIIIQNNILMGGADPRGDGIALGY